MRLKITVENVGTGGTEEVLVGLAVLRQYEEANSRAALPAIDEGFVGPLLELAALAHNRKHGNTASVDDWADVYDVVSVHNVGAPAPLDPAQPSD